MNSFFGWVIGVILLYVLGFYTGIAFEKNKVWIGDKIWFLRK